MRYKQVVVQSNCIFRICKNEIAKKEVQTKERQLQLAQDQLQLTQEQLHLAQKQQQLANEQVALLTYSQVSIIGSIYLVYVH